ncbi:hypothetical protein [Actinophytocola sp.]|uniref:hypothetical protein n=1 Tax=Actinophytocola sp. TaxID=1872138 RepID=UPI003899F51A
MIERIRVHNHLNGTRFSTLEFGFACLAALFIAIALLLQGRWPAGVLACGTAVNCLVVAGFGGVSWIRGDRGRRMRELLRSDARRAVGAEHPRLMMDTLLLAASALIPFALSIAVIVDGVRRRSRI